MFFLNKYHFAKRGYQMPFAHPFLLSQRFMTLLQWVGCAWFRKIQQLFNDCIIYYVDVLLNFPKQISSFKIWFCEGLKNRQNVGVVAFVLFKF